MPSQSIMTQLQQIEQQHTVAYTLLKGSIYHLLSIGYSHLFALHTDETESKQATYFTTWRSAFLEFLDKVPNHFKQITHKEYVLEQDPLDSPLPDRARRAIRRPQ